MIARIAQASSCSIVGQTWTDLEAGDCIRDGLIPPHGIPVVL